MLKSLLLSLAISAALAMAEVPKWTSLFNGESLGQWKASAFPRTPSPRIENGTIQLPAGQPLTGITWSGAFPSTNYELRFQAVRILGGDFFASVTFPAANSFATWVLGGWGGDIVGISSIDGWDAADNQTRSYFNFETGRWYAFRLQVTNDRIRAWIGEERVVDVEIRGHAISLRPGDIKLSAPLGFAAYNTTGGIRNIEYRPLTDKEK